MTGVTRDDGQEGGEEGKGEEGERGEEEGNCYGQNGQDDIEGSIRGPRGPKNQDCFGLQREFLASLPINHIGTEITYSVYIKLFVLCNIFEIVELPRWV